MTDKERVIKGLKCHMDPYAPCADCPYDDQSGCDYSLWEDALKLMKDESEWISIKDRLPDRSGNYLVYTSIEGRSIIKTSYWMASTQTWLGVEACSVLIHITHWMPLPKPPEKEEKHESNSLA